VNEITRYKYGLEIIEGLMGAGKSYYAVRRLCQVIIETRRPVYTNLPLKWPVVRAYLRKQGGEELANLIRPLTKEHWYNFLRRQAMHAQFREGIARTKPDELEPRIVEAIEHATGKCAELIRQQPKLHDSQLWAAFYEIYGPDTLEGVDADAIPVGAVIVIDEVQHWHPMENQKDNKERKLQLQAYLTMCRHHLHWIWVITQDRTRIDILFRNLASSVWRVWNRGEDRLAWGIRFKHLGLVGMGYQRYTKDQLEGRNSEDVDPSESFTILTQLPRNKVYFRLYSSFTNIGSKRQIQKVIQRARVDAGLDADGVTQHEKHQREHEAMKHTQRPSIRKRITRRVTQLVCLTIVGTLAYAIGQGNAQPEIVETIEDAQTIQPHNWPSFNGIAGTRPVFSSTPANVGDRIGDRGTLSYYNPERRSAVITADDGYWLWNYGDPAPSLVGPVEVVQAAYRRMEEAENPGASVPDDPADSRGTVGPSESLTYRN
jgi:hypothetical protein